MPRSCFKCTFIKQGHMSTDFQYNIDIIIIFTTQYYKELLGIEIRYVSNERYESQGDLFY